MCNILKKKFISFYKIIFGANFVSQMINVKKIITITNHYKKKYYMNKTKRKIY